MGALTGTINILIEVDLKLVGIRSWEQLVWEVSHRSVDGFFPSDGLPLLCPRSS